MAGFWTDIRKEIAEMGRPKPATCTYERVCDIWRLLLPVTFSLLGTRTLWILQPQLPLRILAIGWLIAMVGIYVPAMVKNVQRNGFHHADFGVFILCAPALLFIGNPRSDIFSYHQGSWQPFWNVLITLGMGTLLAWGIIQQRRSPIEEVTNG